MGTKINATTIAQPFREDVKAQILELKKAGIEAPLLVGLLANNDPAAKQYAEWTGKACRADGLRYELRQLQDPIDVEAALNEANDDPKVHGIIVYYPIFGGTNIESFSGTSQDDYLRDTVSFKCDVEGLCHTYRTNLYKNVRFLDYPTNTQKCVLPCTALSVVKILETCPGVYDTSKPMGKHMQGKIVTVINRSEIVGRPLAAMLANDGADVYSVDIDSIYLFRGGRLHMVENETVEGLVRKSNIVITGVPTKAYRIPTEWIQPNTTVVNVASFKNVDEEALLKIEGVTYVPMVGKVTVAMLERNLMRLYFNFHHPDRRIKMIGNSDVSGSGNSGGDGVSLSAGANSGKIDKPWYGDWLQVYTACVATAVLAMIMAKK